MRKSHFPGVWSYACTVFILGVITPGLALAITAYDNFGPFPAATWGGTGIPNDAVAVSSQIIDGDITITLAMNATGRFSNPPLTSNAGIFYAGTGSNFGGSGESTTEGALWNFNYYMKVEGTNGATPVLADYQIDFLYDFDPGSGTPLANLGQIDVTASLLATSPASTLVENSQNLLFGFLAVDNLPYLDAPAGVFDPDATGEYQFAIQVSGGGINLETVAMEVHVVPIPAALWLFGSGLLGLIGISRGNRSA